jgi:hypothetical protein
MISLATEKNFYAKLEIILKKISTEKNFYAKLEIILKKISSKIGAKY